MSGTDVGYAAICLRDGYAMSGTDIVYHATCLRARYAMSGTDTPCRATRRHCEWWSGLHHLRSPHALSGTDLAHGPTRSSLFSAPLLDSMLFLNSLRSMARTVLPAYACAMRSPYLRPGFVLQGANEDDAAGEYHLISPRASIYDGNASIDGGVAVLFSELCYFRQRCAISGSGADI
eukprot:3940321-Rhodomonas_salina.11